MIWLAEHFGLASFSFAGMTLAQWHGHEMLFGFAAAVIGGFLLTALPGWAGTPEIEGGQLAFLAFLWLIGRIAFWFGSALTPQIVGIVDSALFFFMALLFLPGLLKAKSKLYWAVVPILLWFAACNQTFYWALGKGDLAGIDQSLLAMVYGLIFLYSIVAGILVPSFTETALRAKGWSGQMTIIPWLEWAAVATVFLYGVTGLIEVDKALAGWTALALLLIHCFRFFRWRGMAVYHTPMVFILHAAYVWFLLSVALRALADFGYAVPPMSSVHAYTIGALGLMKLGLMTRVALKHTGRPLEPSRMVVNSYSLVFFAACIRLYAPFSEFESAMMGISSIAWGLAFAIYFVSYGRLFLIPSLPR